MGSSGFFPCPARSCTLSTKLATPLSPGRNQRKGVRISFKGD